MIAISNCRFFSKNDFITNETILIQDGRIRGFAKDPNPEGFKIVDANQHYVIPGFIDLQIYGSGGELFSANPTVETLSHIEDSLLQTGTTGFLACIATNTPEVFNACIKAAKEHRAIAKNCLGLHLEGPFLNAKKRGAHVAEYVRKATLDEIKALLDFGDGVIKMITIAPELQDEIVIQYLLDHGVIVSLGHSDATFEQATAAYDLGIQTTTHLFNAMSPLHHREPGIPAAVFSHSKAVASIIADGHHVDYEVIKLSKKILKERLFLITDAVTACDRGPYQHVLKGDKFVMPDGTLSGSSLTMLQALQNCVKYCDIELPEAIKMTSLYPAKLLNEQVAKGIIAVGAIADLLVLDKDLNLKEIYFKGKRF